VTLLQKFLLYTTENIIPIDYVSMSVGHLVHVLLIIVYNSKEHVTQISPGPKCDEWSDHLIVVGVKSVYINLPVGARNAQVSFCRKGSGTKARGTAYCPGGPRRDTANTWRRQTATQGRGERTSDPAGQVQRVCQEETGTGDENQGVWGQAR